MRKTLDEELKERYARWEHLYKYGGQDPNWPDGCNMNLVRNHIIFTKEKMKEAGEFTETYYRELPPEVDPEYMARAEEIRINARKSLKVYKSHPDYLYLEEVIHLLNKRQIEETCIRNVISYTKGLEMFIEQDDLLGMRRHKNPERYIESFISCRKRVKKILTEIENTADKEQPRQLTIDDWLTV
jgi:hypothetical protein